MTTASKPVQSVAGSSQGICAASTPRSPSASMIRRSSVNSSGSAEKLAIATRTAGMVGPPAGSAFAVAFTVSRRSTRLRSSPSPQVRRSRPWPAARSRSSPPLPNSSSPPGPPDDAVAVAAPAERIVAGAHHRCGSLPRAQRPPARAPMLSSPRTAVHRVVPGVGLHVVVAGAGLDRIVSVELERRTTGNRIRPRAAHDPVATPAAVEELGQPECGSRVGNDVVVAATARDRLGARDVVSLSRCAVVGDAVERDRHRVGRERVTQRVEAVAEVDAVRAIRTARARDGAVLTGAGADRVGPGPGSRMSRVGLPTMVSLPAPASTRVRKSPPPPSPARAERSTESSPSSSARSSRTPAPASAQKTRLHPDRPRDLPIVQSTSPGAPASQPAPASAALPRPRPCTWRSRRSCRSA